MKRGVDAIYETIYEKPRHLDDDVLEEGVPLDGIVDLRLVLVRQVDGLGVAAALEVEDAVVIPSLTGKIIRGLERNIRLETESSIIRGLLQDGMRRVRPYKAMN